MPDASCLKTLTKLKTLSRLIGPETKCLNSQSRTLQQKAKQGDKTNAKPDLINTWHEVKADSILRTNWHRTKRNADHTHTHTAHSTSTYGESERQDLFPQDSLNETGFSPPYGIS